MRRRNIEPALRAALGDSPVVLVHGARQTGKTTLVQAVADASPARRYLTLDDASVLAAAKGDPDGFISGLDGSVVLDEIQRAPELFRAIKASVDRQRKPGRFLLTGSANVLALPKLAESLAGRMEIIPLQPFSQGELEGVCESFIDEAFAKRRITPRSASRKGMADLIDRALAGGYPEVVSRKDQSRRSAWFGSYLTTILQRDVRDIANIEALQALPRMLALLASRAGTLLNFADLARSLSIPQTTLKRYFALLEATFLVMNLPAWSTSLGQRIVKSPKLFLNDTGLMSHLLGLDRDRLGAESTMLGPLLENFIVLEVMKQASWSDAMPRLFHFRTPPGREVDIVLEDRAGRIVGVDVRSSASVEPDSFKGLQTLAEMAGEKFLRGVVLYTGGETVPFASNMTAMPIAALWQ
jgi:predicted AAA+ superfamily ATPase